MKSIGDAGIYLLVATLVLLECAGVIIPLASKRYSAKQVIVASAFPPYAMYIAATYPFTDVDADDENWEHLSRAIESCNAANAIIQAGAPGRAPQQDINRFKQHWREALHEARLIDCEQLERADNRLGDAVRMYLVPGLELLVEGSSAADAITGQSLLSQFGEVFSDFYDRAHAEHGARVGDRPATRDA